MSVEGDLLKLGAGGLITLVVIKMFDFLKAVLPRNKKNGLGSNPGRTTESKICDLWEAHLGAAARDPEGALRWYLKPSTLEAIEKTAEQGKEQIRLLKKIAGEPE